MFNKKSTLITNYEKNDLGRRAITFQWGFELSYNNNQLRYTEVLSSLYILDIKLVLYINVKIVYKLIFNNNCLK